MFYWVKAVTGVWPLSIHLSMDEEKAVVKVPLVHEGLGEQLFPPNYNQAIISILKTGSLITCNDCSNIIDVIFE